MTSIADQIRALHAAGKTTNEIVAELGVSRGRVYSAVKHNKPNGRPRLPRCPDCGAKLCCHKS